MARVRGPSRSTGSGAPRVAAARLVAVGIVAADPVRAVVVPATRTTTNPCAGAADTARRPHTNGQPRDCQRPLSRSTARLVAETVVPTTSIATNSGSDGRGGRG